ncbi:hypothetical protein M0805_007195 [Coniferiporia weirii]|nr:hypothetical protein M0805_007195 [Coniferiporia weirii]
MSAELEKAIGFESESDPVAWNRRDLLLYAAGIGFGKDDLPFVYDERFAPFPTYPVALPLKGESEDVNLFSERVQERAVPGLPKFNPNRVVHGSQTIEVLKPLPLVSGPGWKVKKRIVGVHENKSGVIIDAENILVDASGTPYAKCYSSAFHVGSKITGQKFSKAIAGPPAAKPPPKDRKPDWVVTAQTSPDQAVLYRLTADYNPLHIDPRIGAAANFGGTILHGLCTFGFAARAVLTHVGGGDANALRFFGARFSSPVRPGDALETAIWELGPGPAGTGTTEVAFVTTNLATGKVCLGAGVAHVKKAVTPATEKSKL